MPMRALVHQKLARQEVDLIDDMPKIEYPMSSETHAHCRRGRMDSLEQDDLSTTEMMSEPHIKEENAQFNAKNNMPPEHEVMVYKKDTTMDQMQEFEAQTQTLVEVLRLETPEQELTGGLKGGPEKGRGKGKGRARGRLRCRCTCTRLISRSFLCSRCECEVCIQCIIIADEGRYFVCHQCGREEMERGGFRFDDEPTQRG